MAKGSIVSRLTRGLSKTRERFTKSVDLLVEEQDGWDNNTIDKIEELLVTSDIGIKLTEVVTSDLSKWAKNKSQPQLDLSKS